ncbi:hypothetical protein VNO80_18312 [Phaseolus coccineus]|uniref:Uncharacterized protein n=1 Tax=Phaseolus coccineus TaxID=3886 RepID=A0AAN9QZC3_PHACN
MQVKFISYDFFFSLFFLCHFFSVTHITLIKFHQSNAYQGSSVVLYYRFPKLPIANNLLFCIFHCKKSTASCNSPVFLGMLSNSWSVIVSISSSLTFQTPETNLKSDIWATLRHGLRSDKATPDKIFELVNSFGFCSRIPVVLLRGEQQQ